MAKVPLRCRHYLATDEIMPVEAMEQMSAATQCSSEPSATRVKPGILEQGIPCLPFLLRPVCEPAPAFSLPKVHTPVDLKGTKMDSVVVRENTEDLYMCIGGTTDTENSGFLSRSAGAAMNSKA